MIFFQFIYHVVLFAPVILYTTIPAVRPPVFGIIASLGERAVHIGEEVWRVGGEAGDTLLLFASPLVTPVSDALVLWAEGATHSLLGHPHPRREICVVGGALPSDPCLSNSFVFISPHRTQAVTESSFSSSSPSSSPLSTSLVSASSSDGPIELGPGPLESDFSGTVNSDEQLSDTRVFTIDNKVKFALLLVFSLLAWFERRRRSSASRRNRAQEYEVQFGIIDGLNHLLPFEVALAVVPATPTPPFLGPPPALPATEDVRPGTTLHGLANQPLTTPTFLTPRSSPSPVHPVYGHSQRPPPPTFSLSRSVASPATPQWCDATLALPAGFGCTSPTPGSDLSAPVLFWGCRAPPSSSTTSTSSTAATQPVAGSSRLAPPTTPGTVEWDVTAEQDLAGTHWAAQMEELLGSEVSMLLDLPHILAAAMVETTDVAGAPGSPPCPRTPSPPTTPGFRRARLPPSPSPQPRALGTAASYMELHELSGSPSVPPLPRDRTTLFRSSPSRSSPPRSSPSHSSPPRSSSSRSSPSAPGVLLPTLIHRSTGTLPAAASIMSIAELGSPVRLLPRAAQAQVAMYGSPGSAGWLEVQAWIAGRVSILRSIRRRSVGMGMLEVEEVVGEVVEMLEEADESGFLLRVSQAHASVTHEGHGAVLEEVSGDPRIAEFQRQVAQFCEGMIPTPPVRALVSEFVRQRVVLERSVVLADVTPSVFNVTPGPAVVEEGEGEAQQGDENIPPSATALGKRKAVEDVFYPS